MRQEKMPPFKDEAEYDLFMDSCQHCDAYGDTLQGLTSLDSLLEPFSLEVLILDGGTDSYVFKVVPRSEQVVFAFSPAHILALRKYLSLDMGKIGVQDHPAQYMLLKDALDQLGGYRGFNQADNEIMDAYCQAIPDATDESETYGPDDYDELI
jgi:hypothetical protein